jgi:uncharacterized protein with PIN domain
VAATGERAYLCDRMVIRLGRWLRAAGHDTAIQERPAGDRALLDRALRENRLLITRDRKLTEFREAPGTVLLLTGNRPAAWAAELGAALAIDWLHRPFSRCLLCNAVLEAAPEAAADRLPERARGLAPKATWCPACHKLYWPGGHVRRMTARLEAWARGEYG